MYLQIYTDGACRKNPGPGGWAFILVKGDEKIYQDSGHVISTTNNKMELMAVLRALQYVYDNINIMEYEGLDILTDSRYVLDGITSWIKNWKRNGWKTRNDKVVLNMDLWKALDEKHEELKVKWNSIKWQWVKAHNINIFNNVVDKLAREASGKSGGSILKYVSIET